MYKIKIILFYIVLGLSAFLWSMISFLCLPLLRNFEQRYRFIIANWCQFAVWLTRVLMGINYQIHGINNLPKGPYIIAANHQSAWETFFLSAVFCPLTQVLKKELLNIPFWGWAARSLNPIAIDRSNPKQALKQVITGAKQSLTAGRFVLIFPEGTRMQPGNLGKFSRSSAQIAAQNNVAIVPIYHNSGVFWSKELLHKKPGTIQIHIGVPLLAKSDDNADITALNKELYSWMLKQQENALPNQSLS